MHGIGQSKAGELVQQGVRTIADLRARSDLPGSTRVALRYFDELRQRIPKEEIAEVVQSSVVQGGPSRQWSATKSCDCYVIAM